MALLFGDLVQECVDVSFNSVFLKQLGEADIGGHATDRVLGISDDLMDEIVKERRCNVLDVLLGDQELEDVPGLHHGQVVE